MFHGIRARILALSALLVFSLGIWFFGSANVQIANDCYCLTVSFLDIGQGDAIYMETPDGYDILIDGGVGVGILRELGEVMEFYDREIDVVVATHPDLDHIGGLPDVFERYDVGTFIETTNRNETKAATALAAAVVTEGADYLNPTTGQIIRLGEVVYIQVLSPTGEEITWETNDASIILRVVFGDTSFMLSGDASAKIENSLVALYGEQLQSDVLKLGHHGSKTSTSEEWLDAVNPAFAIVSAGLDNRYGHPHQEVMTRVFERNIESSHTGTDGTITFISDGQVVTRQ